MQLLHLVVFLMMLALSPALRAAETPAPRPDPHQQMEQEVAALRAAQLISRIARPIPLTVEESAEVQGRYEDLLRRFPNEAEPHVALGEFHLSLGKREAAFAEWKLALTLDPARHDVLAAQADLLLQTGQIVAAADALEMAAKLAPRKAEYPFGLAHVYTLFRRDLLVSRHATEDELITRGTEYFRQAAELAPQNPAYMQAYAEAFYTQPHPDWKLARAAWESLLPRVAGKDFIHSHLVRINIRLHDKAAASEHLAALTDPAFSMLKARLQKQIDKL